MIRRKNILKIAIDSPAAAEAGTLAKAISKHYNLFLFGYWESLQINCIL